MVSWQPTKIMLQQRWGFYMLLTVESLSSIVFSQTYWLWGSGAGALASPLVATQFAQRRRWSFHYLISLAIATLNTIFLICVFKFQTQDGEFNFLFFSNNVPISFVGAIQNVWPGLVRPQRRRKRMEAASTRKCLN